MSAATRWGGPFVRNPRYLMLDVHTGCRELLWGWAQAVHRLVGWGWGCQEVWKVLGTHLEMSSLKIRSRDTWGHIKRDSACRMEEVTCRTKRAVSRPSAATE